MSHAPVAVPDRLVAIRAFRQSTPETLVAQLGRDRFRHLYVDGGQTIQGFLRAGLLDDITVTVIPCCSVRAGRCSGHWVATSN